MNKTLATVFVILSATGTAALANVQRCEVNGEDVNPSNGFTTQNKTGIMRCRSEDGKLLREEEIRQGKFMGLRRFHNGDGSYTESNINERGNRHERYREFYAPNKVKVDENYDNGTRIGLGKRYFATGQIQQITFSEGGRELASVEYQPQGKLSRVRCTTRSMFAEDQAVCGFGGKPSAIELYSNRGELVAKESYLAGVLLSRTELDESGGPARSTQVANGTRTTREFFKDGKVKRETAYLQQTADNRIDGREGTEKEWAQNGQVIRETTWRKGVEVAATQWYMNGSIKEKQTTDIGDRNPIISVESFWDNGKPRAKETKRGSRFIGKRSAFDESGRLRKEEFYDDKGVLKSAKEFDETGKQTKEDEFFEDGSRKQR